MQRFDRALGLLLALRGGERVSAVELARRFEVSTRTIYRDVELLSSLGVPVFAERGRRGGIGILPGYFLPPVTFTTGEAMSLVVALALTRSLAARPFPAELETARAKLLAAVPEHLRALMVDADRLVGSEPPPADIFHPEPPAPEPPPGAVDASTALTVFTRAIFERRRVALRYRSPYRALAEDVIADPLAVFQDRDRWYLVGERVDEPGEPRLWRADRVLRIVDTGRPSAARAPFDVHALLGRRWLAPAMAHWTEQAPVTLAITARQQARLAADWYWGWARFDPAPDGTGAGRVLMTFGESDPAVVLALLRWLGPGAELLEPHAWRALAQAELAAMQAALER